MNKRNYEENFGEFNLNDFKKWIEGQKEDSPYHKNLIGIYVESKVSTKKIINHMETENNKEEEMKNMAKDFKKNGGIINEVDGHYFKIGVKNGEFLIHRMFVKKPN